MILASRPATTTLEDLYRTMNAEIWNLLHDGSILEISGSIPGNVHLAVRIDYLRDRFPDPGHRIVLTLHGCTSFSYQPLESSASFADSAVPLTDLSAIAAAKPEIRHAKDWTHAHLVECGDGDLEAIAEGFSLALDNGRPISFEDLCAVAESYWTEFAKGSERSNP